MPPDKGSSGKKAQAFIDALATLVSEESETFTSTITPELLNAEEYNRLSAIYRKLTPNILQPSHQPSPPSMLADDDEVGAAADISTALKSEMSEQRGRGCPTKKAKRESITISDSDEDEDGKTADTGTISKTETSGQRGRGRPPKKAKPENETPQVGSGDSWKGVRTLGEISLDDSLKKFLGDDPGRRAADFLGSCTISLPTPAEQDMPSQKVLAKLCILLKASYTPSIKDNVRWLFEALAVGDMVVAIYGVNQVNRLTTTMKKDVQGAAAESSTAEDLKAIDGMLTIACNVVFVCKHFRTGSLFWLRSHLTKGFLKHNITKDGGAFEDTKANFRQRGLDRTIEQSGANQLGDAIRAQLRVAFKIDQAGPDLDTTVTDPTNSNGEGSHAWQGNSNDI